MFSSSTSEPDPRMVGFFNQVSNEMTDETKNGLLEMDRLDKEVKTLSEALNQRKSDYMMTYPNMTGEERVKHWEDIEAETVKINDMAEKKFVIARGLRGSIEQISKRFQEENLSVDDIPAGSGSSEEKKDEPIVKVEPESEIEDEEQVDRRKKRKGGKKKTDTAEDTKSYCWCQLEKQEEMIFCDNKMCKFEWFHFSCLGITVAPPGKWYCSEVCEKEAKENPKEESPEPEQKPVPVRKYLKKKK